ncbi:MAG TPA: hypothetical protein VLQ80_00800, partial [Candidatus Saccharimonadia bacterium]|nr:hypothetical protein [Candidatus Saccharimonadia bacterium]
DFADKRKQNFSEKGQQLHSQFKEILASIMGSATLGVVAEDSEARAATPPIPKSQQTSTAASDRKTSRQPSSRQAASGKSCYVILTITTFML